MHALCPRQPMHSPSALMEHASPNLAGFFFAQPCMVRRRSIQTMNGVAHSLRASLPNADSLDLPSHSVLSNGGGKKQQSLKSLSQEIVIRSGSLYVTFPKLTAYLIMYIKDGQCANCNAPRWIWIMDTIFNTSYAATSRVRNIFPH